MLSKIGTLERHFRGEIPLSMMLSHKNPIKRQFCSENFNIRTPGMKFWSFLAQFTLGKYCENIAIILHQMKYR